MTMLITLNMYILEPHMKLLFKNIKQPENGTMCEIVGGCFFLIQKKAG